MKLLRFVLAATVLVAGSASAALTTTYSHVGNLTKADPVRTMSLDVTAGDVIVMATATNKKSSVSSVTYSSTAGALTSFDANTMAGSDVVNSYVGYLTISASGNYDFTATGTGDVTANVALYRLVASSGEVVQLDEKANTWIGILPSETISVTDTLSWAGDPGYGEIAVVGAGSSQFGDLSTIDLTIDLADSAGTKRLLGNKTPLTAGTTSYDVDWSLTNAKPDKNDQGSTLSMAFAEVLGAAPTYSIGGDLSGLSGSVTLQNNGTDDLVLSADGSFAFGTELESGSGYSVTVSSHPATQTCTVSNGSGTVADADVTDVSVSCVDVPTYSVGGTLSGLVGSVTLQNNGGDDLVLGADGPFVFATELQSGQDYAVTVSSQPATQTCTVSNGSGTVADADIADVSVSCVTVAKFSVGGALTGLDGSITLQNNGTDDLVLTSDGAFTFAAKLESGSDYLVTVASQPATQECTVTNGSGTIAGADVSDVAVACEDVPAYSVGGTLSGLLGDTVTLLNNGGDPLDVTENGAFTFATDVKAGDSYSITVGSQPVGQHCTVVSGGTGTVSDAPIDDVVVDCVLAIDDVYEVPTLSEWALVVMSLLIGMVAFNHRRLL